MAADQIGRFLDLNAAEATQHIPGVSIQHDQGEGRYLLIRGTEVGDAPLMRSQGSISKEKRT